MAKSKVKIKPKRPTKSSLRAIVPAKDEERIFRSMYAILSSFWWRLQPIYKSKFSMAMGPIQKRMPEPIRVQITHDVEDPLIRRFVIDIVGMFDASARRARIKIGQKEADQWEIRNQSVYDQIKNHEIKLAASTINDMQAATADEAERILDQMRTELLAGQKAGETLASKTERLSKFFAETARHKARRIAVTESARAHNYGYLAGTADMEVVTGYEWILSDDACDECKRIGMVDGRPRLVKKGSPFATGQSKDEYYATVQCPPLHPGCRCAVAGVLDVDQPEKWDDTVSGSQPDKPVEPVVPEAKPDLAKPISVTKPKELAPAISLDPVKQAIEDGKARILQAEVEFVQANGSRWISGTENLLDRVQAYSVGDIKVDALLALGDTFPDHDKRSSGELSEQQKQKLANLKLAPKPEDAERNKLMYKNSEAYLGGVRDSAFSLLELQDKDKIGWSDVQGAYEMDYYQAFGGNTYRYKSPSKETVTTFERVQNRLKKVAGLSQTDLSGMQVQAVIVDATKVPTAQCDSTRGIIAMGGSKSESTVAHELGHAISLARKVDLRPGDGSKYSSSHLHRGKRFDHGSVKPIEFDAKVHGTPGLLAKVSKEVSKNQFLIMPFATHDYGKTVESGQYYSMLNGSYSAKVKSYGGENYAPEVASVLVENFHSDPIKFVRLMPRELSKLVIGFLDGAIR